MASTKATATLFWVVRAITALILLQTLFFKFTAAPESVAIFTKLGAEPWGRLGSGVAELVAAVLLLTPRPRFAALGALLTLGVISGAILSHLTILGIEVEGDGGTLFVLALVVFAGAATTLYSQRAGLAAWLPARATA
jgi:hypothetical protein